MKIMIFHQIDESGWHKIIVDTIALNGTGYESVVKYISNICGKMFAELKISCEKPSKNEQNVAVKKWIDSIEEMINGLNSLKK